VSKSSTVRYCSATHSNNFGPAKVPASDAGRAINRIRIARLVISVAFGLLVSCGNTIDPQTTGAERLVAVTGLRCEGNRPLAFSPDGRWLVFSRIEHVQGAHVPRERLGLLALPEGKVVWPEPDGQAPGFSSLEAAPRPEQACWSGDNAVYFHRSGVSEAVALPRVGQVAAMVPSPEDDAQVTNGWRIRLEAPGRLQPASLPNDCDPGRIGQWRFESPDRAMIAPERLIKPEYPDGRDSIALRLPDGRLLARHKARAVTSDQVVLAAYAWTPGGRRVAYLLSESMGSLGRPGRAWLLDLERQAPVPLGTGLYSLQWRDDQTLFACGRIGGQREISILRWRFPEP